MYANILKALYTDNYQVLIKGDFAPIFTFKVVLEYC